ncbi:MAG: DUF3145 domain-containing protein [Mycobacteriales bacterium]
MQARGVLYVHSCPAAVTPHVEWAVARVLGVPARLGWSPQGADSALLRAECEWSGTAGTAGQLASALRSWGMLRFEVTEDPGTGVDGERISHIPGHGTHRTAMSANGDVLISEDRLRAVMAQARNYDSLKHGLQQLLGSAWDAELEPYRHAGDGATVSWLHQVS